MPGTLAGFFVAAGLALFVFSLFVGSFRTENTSLPPLRKSGRITIRLLGIALFVSGCSLFALGVNPQMSPPTRDRNCGNNAVLIIKSQISNLESQFESRPRAESWQEFFYSFENSLGKLDICQSASTFMFNSSEVGRENFEKMPATESWQQAATYLRDSLKQYKEE